MLDDFLFIGLPYLAIVIAVVGTVYRTRRLRLGYSSLSSQFLESRQLLWGSTPWHLGILIILLVHLLVLIMPGPWGRLIAFPMALQGVETAGIALAILALVGLAVLILRRLTEARVQPVTSGMDLLLLGLLFLQVLLGLSTALTCHWGLIWSTGTTVPYLWHLLSMQPDVSFVIDLPLVAKAHIVGGWLVILILPFSRLIHLFALPWQYALRPPQKVVWNFLHLPSSEPDAAGQLESRRAFLLGAAALTAGGLLLAAGSLDRLLRYLLGPRMTPDEESAELKGRLARQQETTELQTLEMERLHSEPLEIAKYAELQADTGKYFIDFQLRPGMAFLGADGLPLLLSAKCTHLGCTVGNQVVDGKILCPCHLSYFVIATGQPTPGSPAKAPLAKLGWVLKDAGGKIIAGKEPGSKVTGQWTKEQLAASSVYITKPATGTKEVQS